ncbi:MAG: Gfo/Idh/MocA family oxidoreductase [Lentisphaerae bacterium]|nr:Gfo/Idh/MocA family oxidoreductase [Lentisphaerota bacterium]
MSEEIKVGVVGCGYWGPNLIRNFSGLPGCRLAAVCDVSRERLEHMSRLYAGVACFDNFDRFLKESGCDAVAIATPVYLHYKMACPALESGKHVFIEKPMASSSKECDALVELAAERSLTLMVGHTFLYSAPVRKIKEIVQAGTIGDIRYVSSRRLNLGLFQKDINVVWDLAPHDISIVNYIMDAAPTAVNCQGEAHVTQGIEDVSSLAMFFPGGRFAMIHSSWLDPKKVREMTVVGTKEMILYDDLEPLQKIKIYDQRVERPPHYDTYAEFTYSYHYGDMHAPRIDQVEPLRVECGHFLDCIRTGKRPLTDGRSGRDVVRVLEAASESLGRQGARVEV